MGLVDALKNSGYVPEKSQEGIFQPLEGVYKVQFVVCEKEVSRKTGEDQLRVEFKVTEVLAGTDSQSKFNEFRNWLALSGEHVASPKKGVPFIINALFTAGQEVDQSNDEALISSIQGKLGLEMYVRAWGWTPEGSDRPYQQYSFLQEGVALKKAKSMAQAGAM